jgi:hypothetical protein
VEIGFWVRYYFAIWGAKIKFKYKREKIVGVKHPFY